MLKIIVAGPVKSGKTYLLFIIEKALREVGVKNLVVQDGEKVDDEWLKIRRAAAGVDVVTGDRFSHLLDLVEAPLAHDLLVAIRQNLNTFISEQTVELETVTTNKEPSFNEEGPVTYAALNPQTMINSIRPLMYEPISYFKVEEEELNRFITEYYKLKTPFSCHANERWENDSLHTMDVAKGQLLEESNTMDYLRVKALCGEKYQAVDLLRKEFGVSDVLPYSVRAVLNDLCDKGAIQPGHYLIKV